jgi:[NiFe] hydrogenase diaphorase moiety large subunit
MNSVPCNVRTSLTLEKIQPDEALRRALDWTRPEVIAEITASRLRGRGGAGFPTGVKWNLAAAARATQKFVICNADEGEPGTFKDRILLTQFPDLIIEGMTVAGYAIRATQGILYLRGEYAYMRDGLESMLERRRDRNLLGAGILGLEGFDFDVVIRMGSGAYVCGEETALIESMEGHRGEPRNRPPFPVDTGFLERPSIVNNVETLAWVTAVLIRGANWFNAFGTEKSAGRKLFSVSGDCLRPGVYEVALGVTVDQIVREAGGTGAKAVQVGGASGDCIPASQFSRQISYEDVPPGGSVMIIGPERNMLAVARNFLDFFVDESCGQCTPCRIGTLRLLQGTEKLAKGQLTAQELLELTRLGETMRLASKCGLGQSAPNAFLSIVKNFRDEVMAPAPGARA